MMVILSGTWNGVLPMLVLLVQHISCQTTLPPDTLAQGPQSGLPNWQEENVCNKEAYPAWQCRTGRQCVHEWYRCDNVQNCKDNSDEWACDSEFKCAPSKEAGIAEAFPCEHTFCNLPGIPVCDPNQQFEYKVKLNEEIKIECKMLNNDDALKSRWEFNTYEEGIEYLQSSGVVSGTAYLTVKPKSSFDYGSLRCYSYNETGTSCPCEYTIIRELENINENVDSFFSPTQENINVIEGERVDENITCKINFRGKAHEISWWKLTENNQENEEYEEYEEEFEEGNEEEFGANEEEFEGNEEGKTIFEENLLAKGRKMTYSQHPNEYVEYDEETHKWAEYKLFMRFSTYANEREVKKRDKGIYQCRVWNSDTNVTIIQNVTLNVQVTCKTLDCKNNQYCEDGIGGSDAVCKCKDGYREERYGLNLYCEETCAVKTCPENSLCNDRGGKAYPRCECNDGYSFDDYDKCQETCDIKTCGRFEKCVSVRYTKIGICTCNDGYKYHRNTCVDEVFLNSIKDAVLSFNRLILHPVSFIDELYQKILQDRLIVRDIYEIILSNYLPDADKKDLLCFLNKTSNDGLAENITYSLPPVRLMNKALHAGKDILQTLFMNGSIPETFNDVYESFLDKKCGQNVCNKIFKNCLNFPDELVNHWNLLMDELNMMIKNWKNLISNENRIKESIIQNLIEYNDLEKKIKECSPSKDLVSADLKIKLSEYRFIIGFKKLEKYIMSQLEKRVNSFKNVNQKILERICEDISHPTENCIDSDVEIDISSHKPTSSAEISKMLSGMTNTLQSYNQEEPTDIDECEFEFKCGDGSCISSALKCDGYKHCPDGLDEEDKICRSPKKVDCSNGEVVSDSQICDGKWNCADGSDETVEICSNFCQNPYFRVGGECFLEVGNSAPWHEAKKGCESKGLKFAQIHTKNYDLMDQKLDKNWFWVNSYFEPSEGFTWPATGLRIDGGADPFKDPYHSCLAMLLFYDQPFRDGDCNENKPYLCEKEFFDVAETVPSSYFGAPDGFEWIGEHLVLVPERGTVDQPNHMTWTDALEWCQQDNFKPFVPETTEQWEDMRWLIRKYQYTLKGLVWLPAIDKHINNNWTWYNDEDVSDEWIHYWTAAASEEYNKEPLKRESYNPDAQCLSLGFSSVELLDCNQTRVPMICEYTGDVTEAKVPLQKKKELVCDDTFNITSDTDIYEIDFMKIRGDEGATSESEDGKNTAHNAFGYHKLTYLYWSSKKNVNLSSKPEAVWYQFPVPIKIIKFAFQSYRRNFHEYYAKNYGPTKYEFFGSNSTNCSDQSSWETLFVDDSGTPFNSSEHVKMETLDNKKGFRCYGFKVNEVPNSRYVMIAGVRFWVEQNNWFTIGGESFRLINSNSKNWYDARRICQCLGAELAQPEDPYYLRKYISKNSLSGGWGDYYIGGSDLAREGVWRWINGGSVDVELEDEPLENCLTLGMTSTYCTRGLGKVICERNDVQVSVPKNIAFALSGQYFVVVRDLREWTDARSFCQNLGGDLAVPKDITLLRNYLLKQELIYDYWLGAKKEYNDYDMKWINDEKVDFKNIPSDYVGEMGLYFDFQVSKYPTISENIKAPSLQYFICETAKLMPEFVEVIGLPYEFEECDRWSQDLKCASGRKCFTKYAKCDGRNDCEDGSDEKYCGPNANIYIKVGSQNYLVKEDTSTWQEALFSCIYDGGHLAVPKDLLELKNYLSDNYSHLSYWLGGSDRVEEGTWVWSSGTPIMSGWAQDEPGAILNDQDCLVFNTESNHDKSLSASQCNDKKAFVCEYSENS